MKNKKESKYEIFLNILIAICIILIALDLFVMAIFCIVEGIRTHNAYLYIYPAILFITTWLLGDYFE